MPIAAPTRRLHPGFEEEAMFHRAEAAARLNRHGRSDRSEATKPASSGAQRDTAATWLLIAAMLPTAAAT